MSVFVDLIVAGGRRVRGHAEKQLAGIGPERFARKAVVGGKTIESNHPAFVFGHLSLYPARVARVAGLDPVPVGVPERWEGLFKAGSACLDDPEGKTYPPMEEIVAAYRRGYDHVLESVSRLPDTALLGNTPDEHYRQHFPLVGNAMLVLLCSHPAMHLGQVSAWRRCVGLGPA